MLCVGFLICEFLFAYCTVKRVATRYALLLLQLCEFCQIFEICSLSDQASFDVVEHAYVYAYMSSEGEAALQQEAFAKLKFNSSRVRTVSPRDLALLKRNNEKDVVFLRSDCD